MNKRRDCFFSCKKSKGNKMEWIRAPCKSQKHKGQKSKNYPENQNTKIKRKEKNPIPWDMKENGKTSRLGNLGFVKLYGILL